MIVERILAGRDPEGPVSLGLLVVLAGSIVTGVLLAAAFLLPQTVGALISGRALLGIVLGFAGTVFTLLTAFPVTESHVSDSDDAAPGSPSQVGTGWVTGAVRRVRASSEAIDGPVFGAGMVLSMVVVVGLLVVPDLTQDIVRELESVVFEGGRVLLLSSVLLFVLATVALLFGPWGRIRLGGESASPEFSLPEYVSMVFSAGIAAGIVYWGVVEALLHYSAVPPFVDAAARSDAAVVASLQYTLFHWGISTWSIYLAVGLPIAYAVYNRGAPLRVSSVLVPFLGTDAPEHPLGRVVDVLAVMATVGGLSTTLGFLSAQFLTGIEYRWGVEIGVVGEVLLVVGLTAIFAVSVVVGIHRGIRRFSALNTLGFLLLLGTLALFGPFDFLANVAPQAVSGYVTDFVPMSLYGITGSGSNWLSSWSVFYWSWWLSWAPFVGLFLARISRGRQIRTVILTAVGATSVATLTWFLVVGGTALSLQHSGAAEILAVVNSVGRSAAGFPMFEEIPLGEGLSVVFLFLVLTFFITSADAATRSLALLTTTRESPPAVLSVAMAAFVGTIAAVLTIAGGRETVQSAAVIVGGPFAVVAIFALIGLGLEIRRDL